MPITCILCVACILWRRKEFWHKKKRIRHFRFGRPLRKIYVFTADILFHWSIREQKGLRKRDYLEKCPGPLNNFPRNWFLHDMISWERHDALHVSNNWLHTVHTIKCKGVNFEGNSQQATSNIQALISTTQYLRLETKRMRKKREEFGDAKWKFFEKSVGNENATDERKHHLIFKYLCIWDVNRPENCRKLHSPLQ